MAKRGKKYSQSRELIDKEDFSLEESVSLVKKLSFVKFDESVDISLRMGVNPKHSDQMVRGTIVLPHGTGKTKKVCVIASGEKIKEYPVDSIYGRIIGEVHIDHVPTDFLKTDFQRTSPEWAEVMNFLRGESSLLPETQRKNEEPENYSYIYKLFQGYRRVRTPGRTDMYMGYWDQSKDGPSRISREVEKELYENAP